MKLAPTLLYLPGEQRVELLDKLTGLSLGDGRAVTIWRAAAPEVVVPTGTMAAAEWLVEQLILPGDGNWSAPHLAPYGIATDGGIRWGRTHTVAGARGLARDKLPPRLPEAGELVVFPLQEPSGSGPEVHVVQYFGWADRPYGGGGPSCLAEIWRFGPWAPSTADDEPRGESGAARMGRLTRDLLHTWAGLIREDRQQPVKALAEAQATLDAAAQLAEEAQAHCRRHGLDEVTIIDTARMGWEGPR